MCANQTLILSHMQNEIGISRLIPSKSVMNQNIYPLYTISVVVKNMHPLEKITASCNTVPLCTSRAMKVGIFRLYHQSFEWLQFIELSN